MLTQDRYEIKYPGSDNDLNEVIIEAMNKKGFEYLGQMYDRKTRLNTLSFRKNENK